MRNVPLQVAVRPVVEVAVTVTAAGKPGFPAPDTETGDALLVTVPSPN